MKIKYIWDTLWTQEWRIYMFETPCTRKDERFLGHYSLEKIKVIYSGHPVKKWWRLYIFGTPYERKDEGLSIFCLGLSNILDSIWSKEGF